MAEALLGWARNIIYYMVFLSLAEHLLAGSSYGRYLRLFGGLVLVLVVLGPFGSLGDWEKQVSSLFDQFTFRQESWELKKEIFGMEEKRLAGITGQYRENVEKEITAFVKAQGIVCSQVSVQMEENKESSSYGKILAIEIEVSGEDFFEQEGFAQEGAGQEGSGRENIRAAGQMLLSPISEERPVSIGRIEIGAGEKREDKEGVKQELSEREKQAAETLKGKVETDYGLEGEAVKIKWKND